MKNANSAVIEAHGILRHNFQRPLAGFEDLGVNGIAQGSDQPVDARRYFFDDQALGGRFRLGIDFNLIAPLPQQINRIADITRSKNTNCFGHCSLWLEV
jgi:hypothetical protein